MARQINFHKQHGFSLVEALFSSVILGIALLALAGFHAVALQDGSLIKARAVGASLAKQKMDDLRSFSVLFDDPSTTGVNECGNGTFCFSEIADNAGGQEDASGNLALPSGSVSGYADAYTRNWTATCAPAPATGAALSFSTTCNTSTVAKLVTVTISWNDSKGASQTVSLQEVIYAVDPSRTARGALNPFSSQKPKVGYTPIGVPDAVPVPISTGDGKFKESSKPLPDVSSKGYSLRTEFDAVAYTTTGGTSKKDSQLEFATVNCVCEFAGSGAGYPASYFYWDGASLQIKTPGATVTKMTGTAPSISGDQQDPLCDDCCRDHHDSEAPGTANPTTALYDPYRLATDYSGNNHKHYYYQSPSNPAAGLVEVAESAGNRYLEACRFVRVDGLFRLLQDWRALDVVVMPKDNYLETASTLTAYQTYLVDWLRYQSRVDCTAAGGTGCSDIDLSNAPDKSSLATRNRTENVNAKPQLLARALYSDPVYSKTAPRTLDASYYTGLAARINEFESNSSVSWLDRVPFNEVNVTLLASWHSDDPASVSVRNDKILSISSTSSDYYGVYYRGEALVNSGGDGIANIYAHLLPSNSGLTGGVSRCTYPAVNNVNCDVNLPDSTVDYDNSLAPSGTISYASEIGTDRHDHKSSGRKSNSLQITRSGAGPAVASGSVRVGNSSVDLSTVTVSQTPTSAACSVSYTAGDNSGSFSCAAGYTGDVQISGTGYFFNTSPDDGDGKFDAALDTGGSYINTNSCPSGNCGNFWVFGPTAYVTGKCHGNQCGIATFASTVDDGTTLVPCTLDADGSTVKCLVTLDASLHTWTGKIKIAGNGSIYVKADATSCDSTALTTPKLTATAIAAGPADKQSAFNVCATDVSALPSPPSAPASDTLGLSMVTITGQPVARFTWGNVANETGYTVYRCDIAGDNECSPSSLVSSPGMNVTSTDQTRPSNNETSCFNVKAFNAGGFSAASLRMCVFRSGSGYTVTGPK